VTSNHIHLLVRDGKEGEVIPQTMQLIAGRTGQEYNQRKNRNGAFWEDRYHATKGYGVLKISIFGIWGDGRVMGSDQ
jgi:putative transposase